MTTKRQAIHFMATQERRDKVIDGCPPWWHIGFWISFYLESGCRPWR